MRLTSWLRALKFGPGHLLRDNKNARQLFG